MSKLLDQIQYKVAVSAVPPSATRGAGSEGAAAASREFLSGLDLSKFATDNVRRFRERLERETGRLQDALPQGAQYWGLARKLLNLFLRDAYYNKFLHDRYHLSIGQYEYEVPLDGVVAHALRRAEGGDHLPAWVSVRALSQSVHASYQAFALNEAARRRILRVHLDTWLWPAFSRKNAAV